jgi:CdiI immunity protein
MSDLKTASFPELQRVFAGYLHEDFVQVHGTAAAAIQAFHADANDSERRRFAREAQRFLQATERMDFAEVQALVTRFGARWVPDSRAELEAVLATQRRAR